MIIEIEEHRIYLVETDDFEGDFVAAAESISQMPYEYINDEDCKEAFYVTAILKDAEGKDLARYDILRSKLHIES